MHEIKHLLDLVEDPELREKLQKMHVALLPEMEKWPAAVRHHHWWKGGYLEHVTEVMNNVCVLVQGMGHTYDDFEVSLDDALLTAYVHDLDKLTRYQRNLNRWPKGPFAYREDKLACESTGLVAVMCTKFDITLTEEQLHAITFHHGGWSVLFKEQPYADMSPLATVLHCADLLSSKIRGTRRGDPQ